MATAKRREDEAANGDAEAAGAPDDENKAFGQAIANMPFGLWHYQQTFAVSMVFLAAGTTTAALSWIEDDIRAVFSLKPAEELPIVFTSLAAVTLSLFTAGACADQLGRKNVALAGLWALLTTQMSIGAAQSPIAVAVLFGLRGFSVHYAEDAAKGYLTEVLPATGRGMVLNLLHASWQLGGILFSVITIFTTAYTQLAVFSSLSAAVALFFFISFTMESPLWLYRNRGREAGLKGLRRMHAECNVPWPEGELGDPNEAKPGYAKSTVPWTLSPGDGFTRVTARCRDCCSPSRLCGCLQRAYGPLFGEHRRLTALITMLYLSMQLGTWSNDTWLKRMLGESGKEDLETLASFLQYGCKFGGAILGGLIVEKTGRKMLLIPCFFLVSLGTALIGLSTKLDADASTRLFFVAMVLLYVPIEVLASTLGTFTYESFPTEVRVASLGVARGIAGILGTTYASLGPVIMGAIGPAGLFYINASILLMGCGTCLLIARDTTGVTLR